MVNDLLLFLPPPFYFCYWVKQERFFFIRGKTKARKRRAARLRHPVEILTVTTSKLN